MAEIILANLSDISGFSTYGPTLTGSSYSASLPGVYYVNQSGTFTFNLPSPSQVTTNTFVIVKDKNGQANSRAIIVAATGGATIDGASQVIIDVDYGAVFLTWNGSNWSRLG